MTGVCCDKGFSLIEMLVAMAILAMTATALLEGQAGSLRAAHSTQAKSLAGIVADCRLALALGAADLPTVGSRSGEAEMLQQADRWQEDVRLLSRQGLLVMTVRVQGSDGKVLTQRTGYRRAD